VEVWLDQRPAIRRSQIADAVRAEYACDFPQVLELLLAAPYVFHDVVRDDDVERVTFTGQARPLGQREPISLFDDPRVSYVDPPDLTFLPGTRRELRRNHARARPDVEDAGASQGMLGGNEFCDLIRLPAARGRVEALVAEARSVHPL
jgi:hypothetical protein